AEVGAEHGAVPDGGFGLDPDVPDQGGGGSDPGLRADLPLAAFEGEKWHPPIMHPSPGRRTDWLRLRLGDVDQPGNAELVDAHAELVAPDLLLQRHFGDSARGELLEVAAQRVAVVTGQAHREAGRGLELHVAGHVGGHERVSGVALQLPVHDLAGVGAVRGAHVAERHDVELAAEHCLVEVQRLRGGAVEVEVWIQPRGHGLLPEVSSMSGRYPPAADATSRAAGTSG